jgi:hypothetical protein
MAADILETISTKQMMIMYIVFRIASDFAQSLPEPRVSDTVPAQIYATFYKFITLVIGDAKSSMNVLFSRKLPMLPAQEVTQRIESSSVSTSSIPKH